jgi:perosamine synthetase
VQTIERMPVEKSEIFMAGPQVTESDIAIVTDMLRNGWYGKEAYKYVELFEKEFAIWHGRKHALMTPNCTHAIHLLLTALGIGKDDEVIVPDVTWIATAAPIRYLQAKPVFADVDPETWCLSAETILEKITSKTKAVIVVDLYGNMPGMDEITKICKERNIHLIEDAAEAIGSKLGDNRAGSFGVGSVFSFHRTKTLTTGEGGMLVLDDEKLFERAKFLRDHGRAPGTYFNTEVTYKYMPSNLAASIGYAQFLRIDELVNKKRWIWQEYKKRLGNLEGIRFNPQNSSIYNSVWSTVLVADKNSKLNRDIIMDGFEQNHLPTRPFFYLLSELPAFEEDITPSHKLNTVADGLSRSGVCLPSSLNITEGQIDEISDAFLRIYNSARK